MICNCTPHNIKVYSKDHQKVLTEFPASGNQIRLESSQQFELPMLKVDGNEIPCVTSQKFNPKINWPKLDDSVDTILVSMPVGNLVENNFLKDVPYNVMGPDTGPSAVVRDENGRILGTTRLILYKSKSK